MRGYGHTASCTPIQSVLLSASPGFSKLKERRTWKLKCETANVYPPVLHILCTLPDHHRRGAGGMLVRWGLEQADKTGLRSYLEASEAGRPLYERLGFREVEVKLFDLSKYGGHGIDRGTVMMREPEVTNGAS